MMNRKKLIDKIEDALDFVYNDTSIAIGKVILNVYTVSVSLWFAITNSLPIIPQWVWTGIFLFMLVVGAGSLADLVYLGVDDDEEEFGDEDDEIADD